MSESKAPVIHISGTVTEKAYTDAVRAHGIRAFLKFSILYILLMFLFRLGVDFYYWYPYLKAGYVTFAEYLNETLGTIFIPSLSTYILAGFIVIFALFLIIIRPNQEKKRLHELDPDGFPVTYDFFDDVLVISSASQTADETFRLKYSDVQKRIRETKFVITLLTGQRNRIGLYKTVMTPQETEQVQRLLKERCPQRKTKA
ncbi:MAG: hypothetical protein IKF49_07970 [Clostridia bacterium]|nr:hypothetical protein [Clostridia bacterium]